MSETTGTEAIADMLSYIGFGIDGLPGCIYCHRFARTRDIAGIKHADDCVQEAARAEFDALRARCETAEAERDMLHAALDAYDAGRLDYARGVARDSCPFDERDVRESWEHGWDRSAAEKRVAEYIERNIDLMDVSSRWYDAWQAAEARVAELEAALNAVCDRLTGDTIRGYYMHISSADRDTLEALADHAGDADATAGKDGAT